MTWVYINTAVMIKLTRTMTKAKNRVANWDEFHSLLALSGAQKRFDGKEWLLTNANYEHEPWYMHFVFHVRHFDVEIKNIRGAVKELVIEQLGIPSINYKSVSLLAYRKQQADMNRLKKFIKATL